MIKQVNINMGNFRYILSIGLGAATLAVVLTYVLGAQALLQTPQAEEEHNLFMSMFKPLIQAITGGHRSMAQIHGGSPATLPAGGLAVIVVTTALHWRQRHLLCLGSRGHFRWQDCWQQAA